MATVSANHDESESPDLRFRIATSPSAIPDRSDANTIPSAISPRPTHPKTDTGVK